MPSKMSDFTREGRNSIAKKTAPPRIVAFWMNLPIGDSVTERNFCNLVMSPSVR